MAMQKQRERRLNAFEFVGRGDDALDFDEKDAAGAKKPFTDYDNYLKTGDEKFLVFRPGQKPTRFLLNLEFSGKEGSSVKNEMMGGSDEEGKPKVTLGSWQYRVSKMALKAITNPPDLPLEASLVFKADHLGYAHDDLLAELDRMGVVGNIFSLYSALILTPARANAKN